MKLPQRKLLKEIYLTSQLFSQYRNEEQMRMPFHFSPAKKPLT